ncbi:MAG: hypothetical protein DRI61_15335, partial [Chloroflexi bacterium]
MKLGLVAVVGLVMVISGIFSAGPVAEETPLMDTVDLSISDMDLVVSNQNPTEGDTVTIEATIHGDQSQDAQTIRYGPVIDVGGTGQDLHIFKPCVIKMPNGTYRMWYAGDGDDGMTYYHRIFTATSPDGISWVKQGMVLDYGGSGQEHGVLYPFVYTEDFVTYHMWYTGINYGNHANIQKAISYDGGITWTKQGLDLNYGSSSDPSGASYPFVYHDGSIWHMWYAGVFWGSPNQCRIAHAHKAILDDAWTKDGIVIDNDGPYDYPSAAYPFVIPNDEGYEMYYTGYAPYTGPSRILHALSDDGLSWTKSGIAFEGTLPEEYNFISMADVKYAGGIVKYWYTGYDGSHQRIFYAEEIQEAPGQDATCTVSFYVDDILPGNMIHQENGVSVPGDGVTTVSFNWAAELAGAHEIMAVISDSIPAEIDLSNNDALVTINIQEGQNQIVDLFIDDQDLCLSNPAPTQGETITIGATVHGDTGNDGGWQKHGVVIDIEPDEYRIAYPSVLKLDNGTYMMWYQHDDDGSESYGYRIYRAFSYDGINWNKQGLALDYGNAYEQHGAGKPYVMIADDGVYHMWYVGIGYSGGYRYYIHHAVSYDLGDTWTKLGKELGFGTSADPDGSTGPHVIYKDGTWHMWYTGVDWTPGQTKICYAHKTSLSDPWIREGVVMENDGTYDNPHTYYP